MADTDEDLFDSALAGKPEVEETPEAPAKPETDKRPRDDEGKFSGKEPKPVEAKGETPKPEDKQQEIDHRVPLGEFLSLRERAQKAEAGEAEWKRQAEEGRARLAAWERKLAEKPQEHPKAIDPYEDPQGFVGQLQSGFRKEMQEARLTTNLQLAEMRHGTETLGKAYEAVMSAAMGGDLAPYQRVMQSPDQGEAMVHWYKEREALREIGTDPASYKQKALDAALQDPAFVAKAFELGLSNEELLGKAVEAARARAAGGNGAARPNTLTSFPPSMSRTPGGSSAVESDVPESDEDTFNRSVSGLRTSRR